jgi:hypothetical protein
MSFPLPIWGLEGLRLAGLLNEVPDRRRAGSETEGSVRPYSKRLLAPIQVASHARFDWLQFEALSRFTLGAAGSGEGHIKI